MSDSLSRMFPCSHTKASFRLYVSSLEVSGPVFYAECCPCTPEFSQFDCHLTCERYFTTYIHVNDIPRLTAVGGFGSHALFYIFSWLGVPAALK